LRLDRPARGRRPDSDTVWSKVDLAPQPAAIAAARSADVVIAVLGISSELEGEEMQVSEPGFQGGDRMCIDLPKPELDLLEALATASKPLVLVLTNGSALAVNWAKEHVNAVLDAWYPGEEGGTAVAETLSGKNNPAGRLPVTFCTGVDQLPPFDSYAMKGRTYRYFEGTPLYPFGYGLSYMSMVTEAGEPVIPEGKYSMSVGGGQPNTGAATVAGTFEVKGTTTLP
jgi:beta-glucosidase